MNLELFNNLMKERPEQHRYEWWMFLEICEIYLKKHKIENPIVVELGTYGNCQKKFYEQLLGAEHIGIDVKRRHIADIWGDSHDPKTLERLKDKLNNRPINILFIDAGHRHEDVKTDFEMYSPLCTDIIAFHDIEAFRYIGIRRKVGVWKFWDELKTDELKTMASEYKEEHKDLFLSIDGRRNYMGIGMIIKR